MKNIDLFRIPVPSFNFKSEDSIRTIPGAFISTIIGVTVFLYSMVKVIEIFDPNPMIAKYQQEVYYTKDSVLDF